MVEKPRRHVGEATTCKSAKGVSRWIYHLCIPFVRSMITMAALYHAETLLLQCHSSSTVCDNITLMFRFVSEKRLDRFILFRFRPFGLIGQESMCIKQWGASERLWNETIRGGIFRRSPTAWRKFVVFDKWPRCTASTRDSVFCSTSVRATKHRLYAACYGKRVWGLVAFKYISFCRSTRKRGPGSGRLTKMAAVVRALI